MIFFYAIITKSKVATLNMKINLNSSCLKKNINGFANIITLVLLPIIAGLLYSVTSVVIVTSFKAEYKYTCIDESLKAQDKILPLLAEAESRTPISISKLNNEAKMQATFIATKLKNIKTAVEYENSRFEYPEIELQQPIKQIYNLAFYLDYAFITKYKITCGIKIFKENNIWKSEIIY